ncbi:MAG: fibronectin type III domain-containing protein [bacterium]
MNPGVTYSAQIRVYNNQNAWSQYANGCGSFTTLSNQPQVVTYKTADEITPTSATVHWTYTDPENDPQTEYEVGLSTSSNFISTPFVKIDTGAVTNASFSGLTPDTTYYVRVKAKNDVNGWSAYSTGLFKTTINTINATCGPSSLFVSPNQPVIWTTNASGGT